MPEAAAAPAPGGAPPSAPQSPGQTGSPIGVSPATQPTANRGYEMAGMQRLGVALKQLESLVPMLGAASDAGRDVLSCISKLAKHVQPGSVTPAAEKNTLMQQMMAMQQRMKQNQDMRSQMPQQGAPKPPQQASMQAAAA